MAGRRRGATGPQGGRAHALQPRGVGHAGAARAGTALMRCRQGALALLLAVTAMAAAGADSPAPTDYPAKPVRFISPFSAGGGTDTVARTLATRLGEQMGRVFVVDNRGGAEGVVGTEIAAKAPAD